MATMPVTTPLDDDNAHTFEVKNKRKQTVEQTIEPPFDIPIPSSQPSQPNNDMIVLIEDTVSLLLILSISRFILLMVLWISVRLME